MDDEMLAEDWLAARAVFIYFRRRSASSAFFCNSLFAAKSNRMGSIERKFESTIDE